MDRLLLAGIVFIGVITVGKAIITGLAMGRRSSHPWRNNPVLRHPRKRRKFRLLAANERRNAV